MEEKYNKITINHLTLKHQHNHNVPRFSDGQVWANSIDPDQTAPDQGLHVHCLLFCLHLLDHLLHIIMILF